MKCNHNPPCIDECRVCGEHLPEWPAYHSGLDNKFVVVYENGSKNYISAADPDEAAIMSIVGIARAAGLCLKHTVRVIRVEECK